MTVDSEQDHVGALVRRWRERRRLSQQALSDRCGVSTRHLSYIETGKSVPSPSMISQLGDALEVPLRVQRRMFTAAGFAPGASELPLDSPALAQVNEALELILAGHEPYPALVIDGGWDLVAANDAAYRLLADVPADLLEPPVNFVRLSLDPRGLAPRIANLDEWRAHLLDRLRREVALTADPRLAELHDEVAAYPGGEAFEEGAPPLGIAVPLRLRGDGGELRFFSTVATFGTAIDVTLAELSIEAFFPADADTAAALRALPQG
jgi:transcriptional regulator with XRE-family HTH domain